FDNTNAQVVVPHSDPLALSDALTMSAWIFNDSSDLAYSYRIISKESFGKNDNFWLSLQNRWLWMGIGGSFFSPEISLLPNQWYHIVGTFDDDADEVRMYIDGVEVLSENTSATLTSNSDSLFIGSNWEEFKWWEGLLDDIRLYDRALTAEEIEELYKSAPAGGGGETKPPEPPSELCTGNFLDEFNQREYSGNDGSLSWSTDWSEINEDSNPTAGDEQVRSDLGHDYVVRIRDNDGGGEGIQRQADISTYTKAALSFIYSRDSLDNSSDYVTVEVSKDGVDWNEVERIEGPGTDNTYLPVNVNISSYISPQTSIRFLTSPTMGGQDIVYIDNVEIEVSGCAE
ncbi:MAG: LamG domain-containing protein, partial [Gammaproteobacteria bacterium]